MSICSCLTEKGDDAPIGNPIRYSACKAVGFPNTLTYFAHDGCFIIDL